MFYPFTQIIHWQRSRYLNGILVVFEYPQGTGIGFTFSFCHRVSSIQFPVPVNFPVCFSRCPNPRPMPIYRGIAQVIGQDRGEDHIAQFIRCFGCNEHGPSHSIHLLYFSSNHGADITRFVSNNIDQVRRQFFPARFVGILRTLAVTEYIFVSLLLRHFQIAPQLSNG